MVLSRFSRKGNVVNLVINDHAIRYLELKQVKPPIASKWGERLLPNGIINNGKILDFESLTSILEECIHDWKLRNRQIRFLIPESFVIIRKLSIPAEISDDEIKGYLYLELGSSIHLPFDEPVFDCIVLGEKEDKKELLLFAAQEENVMDYVDLFSHLNLKPIEAEISPLALYRLYHHLDLAHKDEDLLVVQFNLNSVNICIFENTIPFFMHHLPLDFDENQWDIKLNHEGNYELKFIGDERNLSFQFEDSYKEITRIMDFYRYSLHQGQKQVSKILLNGDHPMLLKIKKDLGERLDTPIETISYNGVVPTEIHFPVTHYLLLGLALKGVQ